MRGGRGREIKITHAGRPEISKHTNAGGANQFACLTACRHIEIQSHTFKKKKSRDSPTTLDRPFGFRKMGAAGSPKRNQNV
jgi:hypothetical protein